MKQKTNVRKILQKVEEDNRKFQKMLDGMGGKSGKLQNVKIETKDQKDFQKHMQKNQTEYEKNQRQLDQKIDALEKKLEQIEKENGKLRFIPNK